MKLETTLPDLLVRVNITKSLAETRKIAFSNKIKLNGFIVKNTEVKAEFHVGDVLEIGKTKIELNESHFK